MWVDSHMFARGHWALSAKQMSQFFDLKVLLTTRL